MVNLEGLARKVHEFGKLNVPRQRKELERLYLGFSPSAHGKNRKALDKELVALHEAKQEGA